MTGNPILGICEPKQAHYEFEFEGLDEWHGHFVQATRWMEPGTPIYIGDANSMSYSDWLILERDRIRKDQRRTAWIKRDKGGLLALFVDPIDYQGDYRTVRTT